MYKLKRIFNIISQLIIDISKNIDIRMIQESKKYKYFLNKI